MKRNAAKSFPTSKFRSMARITVEARPARTQPIELVMLAAQRARDISARSQLSIDREQ